mmetsp:Transcript_40474/g.94486  ORF Transcript_40474/g.94486 Transcript_40474/m.94486 type:complete len:269 (+) Transcript_40474:465-1271(+)
MVRAMPRRASGPSRGPLSGARTWATRGWPAPSRRRRRLRRLADGPVAASRPSPAAEAPRATRRSSTATAHTRAPPPCSAWCSARSTRRARARRSSRTRRSPPGTSSAPPAGPCTTRRPRPPTRTRPTPTRRVGRPSCGRSPTSAPSSSTSTTSLSRRAERALAAADARRLLPVAVGSRLCGRQKATQTSWPRERTRSTTTARSASTPASCCCAPTSRSAIGSASWARCGRQPSAAATLRTARTGTTSRCSTSSSPPSTPSPTSSSART